MALSGLWTRVTRAALRQRHLEQEHAAITRRLGGRTDPLEPGGDSGEQAARAEARELSHAAREQLVVRRKRLAAALARIEEGAYGVCLGCGDPISERRLDAMPEAERCLACQSLVEQDAARRATRGFDDEEDVTA